MPQLQWGTPGTRFYETGVDRGVLYVNGYGVAWNGITSVKENSSGGDPQPYYLDGVKVNNIAASEEYAATISAFSSPAEFSVCDGTVGIQNGLFITQQKRKRFSFSYRTLKGNDVDGLDHAYKIHLVYNALAGPADTTNNSLGASADANSLSWSLTTTPPRISGYTPSAHLVIDSSQASAFVLTMIESILYGTDTTTARMPDISEVMSIFGMVVQTIEFSKDDNSAPSDFDYIESPTAPQPEPGHEVIWLNTTNGTLNDVIGD